MTKSRRVKWGRHAVRKFKSENLKGRENLHNLGTDGSTILKLTLNE
jgi:hypothetical protein